MMANSRQIRTSPRLRPEIRDLPFAVHGGPALAELERLGLDANEVLDFSANINPYGPAPGVHDVLTGTPIDRYPDPEARSLLRELSEYLHVPACRILAGNGASELIWLTALAFVRPGDRVLVLGPTYAEYARAAGLMGARVETWQAAEENGFAVAVDEVAAALTRVRPRLAFLCNPNNPTGITLAVDAIARWAHLHPQTLFAVDEAYLPLVPAARSALEIETGNILVIRSMTKDFGLAGLRLGYAVGPEDVIDGLSRARPPWSVNALAQAAGIAALGDLDYYRHSLETIDMAKVGLSAALCDLGFEPMPSTTPFFLLPVGDGAAFRAAMLQHRILVRNCASFGLPHHVRIATRRPEENARLLMAIEQVALSREAAHAG